MRPPEIRHLGTPIPGVRLSIIRNERQAEYVVMADGIEVGAVPDRMMLAGIRSVEIDWFAVRASVGLPETE